MSRKSRQSQRVSESRRSGENIHSISTSAGSSESTASRMMDTTKQTLSGALDSANNHRVLVGSILAGCGTAIFLFATNAGRSVRSSVGEQIGNVYGSVSDQVGSRLSQLKDAAQRMISSEEMIEEDELDIHATNRPERTSRVA